MTAPSPFTLHRGTAPLLISFPHVGTHVPPALVLDDWLAPKRPRAIPPDPAGVAEAAEAILAARRPLVVVLTDHRFEPVLQ